MNFVSLNILILPSFRRSSIRFEYCSRFPFSFSFKTESGKINNYSLYAIIYHHGNSDYGHYNCNVKINDKWYFIDDETINLVNNINDNNINSYILFYRIE